MRCKFLSLLRHSLQAALDIQPPPGCRRPAFSQSPHPQPTRLFPSPATSWRRSEEHTSELQSQSNLVCRLLLEKKKKLIQRHTQDVIAMINEERQVRL